MVVDLFLLLLSFFASSLQRREQQGPSHAPTTAPPTAPTAPAAPAPAQGPAHHRRAPDHLVRLVDAATPAVPVPVPVSAAVSAVPSSSSSSTGIIIVVVVVLVEAVGHHEGRGRRRRRQRARGLVPRRLAQQEAELEPEPAARGPALAAAHLDADAVEAGRDGALDVGLAAGEEGAVAEDQARGAELDLDDRRGALGERPA